MMKDKIKDDGDDGDAGAHISLEQTTPIRASSSQTLPSKTPTQSTKPPATGNSKSDY